MPKVYEEQAVLEYASTTQCTLHLYN